MKFYEFMGYELIEKVKNKELTVQEIIQSCFERIQETESKLHSFVQLKEDQALKKAIKADENLKKGRPIGRLFETGMECSLG